MRRSCYLFTGACVCLAFARFSPAEVRTLAHYELGENDPGADPSTLGRDPTIDGGPDMLHLSRSGTPHYSADTAPGSRFSMQFSGQPIDAYFRVPLVTLKTDNVGIEAWAKAPASGGEERGVIAYDGLRDHGFGLVRIPDATPFGGLGAVYAGTLGDAVVGMAAVPDAAWTHLALVRDGGVTTFYVNGVAAGSSTAQAPEVMQGFSIGAGYCAVCDRPIGTEQYFGGLVDDVRVFDFTSGQFNAAADLSYQVVPEPGGIAAIAAGLLLVRRHRRVRRTQGAGVLVLPSRVGEGS